MIILKKMVDKPQKYKDLDELVSSIIVATSMGSSAIISYINDVPYVPIFCAVVASWAAIDTVRSYYKVRNRL